MQILGLLTAPAQIQPFTGQVTYTTRTQQALLPQPEDAKSAEK